MRIHNQTDEVVTYELRGGPLMMILSTCDLEPGEIEEYKPRFRDNVQCEVVAFIGDLKVVGRARDDEDVVIVAEGDGYAVRRAET